MDAENSLPHDLGSGGRPCRFESCYPQPKGLSQNAAYTRYVAATDRVRTPYPVYSGYFATAPLLYALTCRESLSLALYQTHSDGAER